MDSEKRFILALKHMAFLPPVPLGTCTRLCSEPNGWDSLIDGVTVGLLKRVWRKLY